VFFDAHLRLAAIGPRHAADLRFFGVEGALCPLPEAGAPATAPLLRRAWDDLSGRSVKALRRAGLAAFASLAVPPARIPLRGLEALLAELPEFLSRRGVAAVGPLALGGGTPREEEVLSRQLELARDLRRPVLACVPPRGPVRATRRLVAILRESEVEPGSVLVDGIDARSVRTVRAVGYGAVLSLSAGRDAVEEAARTVRELGPEGIALASHAGDGLGDLLAIPRAADRLSRLGLSEAVIRRVCGRNALSSLGIEPAALRSAVAPSDRSGRRTSR
jgi:predicted metal-dependent TIM-barrel fold hydrolase